MITSFRLWILWRTTYSVIYRRSNNSLSYTVSCFLFSYRNIYRKEPQTPLLYYHFVIRKSKEKLFAKTHNFLKLLNHFVDNFYIYHPIRLWGMCNFRGVVQHVLLESDNTDFSVCLLYFSVFACALTFSLSWLLLLTLLLRAIIIGFKNNSFDCWMFFHNL